MSEGPCQLGKHRENDPEDDPQHHGAANRIQALPGGTAAVSPAEPAGALPGRVHPPLPDPRRTIRL